MIKPFHFRILTHMKIDPLAEQYYKKNEHLIQQAAILGKPTATAVLKAARDLINAPLCESPYALARYLIIVTEYKRGIEQ